jgi:predicted RNA-binding Zn-ribbon protein involved in translation (DUF1610 family)
MHLELPQQIICSICGYQAELDEKDQAYKCPVCGTETWTDEKKLKVYIRDRKIRQTAEDIREINKWRVGSNLNPEVLPIHPFPTKKGGSNNSGRKHKKAVNKRKEWQAV